ncbi:ribonuclease R [Paucilactobacillus suebicus]|uniref:Ribonuclease R n=1 Tax=Paucilactobacillus suebicus DSM 5007 = KCTC 3549 TaxID=1423807 RepID=A0A0R1WC26_9LACO|nr:ribonuclease R [Paucilactobacillus suebicus]KRM13572.1 ribonuclease R [Paucilactobacillus suebicus DSM 5007 = KCTC 3549]
MTINLKEQIQKHLQDNAELSFSAEKIATQLNMKAADQFPAIVQTLAQLEREQEVKVTDNGEFQAVPKKPVLSGIFHGNDKGFGFVAYDPDQPDIYVNPDHTMHALSGDEVEVDILRPGKPDGSQGPEGQVTRIITHHYEKVVGEFKLAAQNGYIGEIVLKDKKISSYKFYVTDQGIHPTDGEVVTADVTRYPTNEEPKTMVGVAKETIGNKDEPGVDILSIVYAHELPHEFPEDVVEQADHIEEEISEDEKKDRVDITDQPLVTIDSTESKDLDDAVVAWKMDNGNYHLGVHIADVSHYVQEGTPLDREAYDRGTSVYLTDRVIPMLPRRLSNGICSLNPGVERLSMSCEMEINSEGKVVNHKIFPSVMKSHARMTYKGVNAILEAHDKKTREKYSELVPMFEDMADLHRILVKMRHRRGAIDFDAPEAKIVVDEEGHPTDIVLRDRGLSERMIESFMLAANETVAEHFKRLHVPFLYRIHETPDGERVKNFFEFLSVIGHPVRGDISKLKPKMLQNVLKDVAGTPEEQMVQTMMLRSMKQAKYSDESVGHFGLDADFYTHFTSPIRRYPDTTVHRLIKWYAKHGTGDDAQAKYEKQLPEIAEHTSVTERRGIDTERDVDSMKKAEYMEDHVGETFNAVVSSVMKFGLFVALENTVEGLIHISNMNDDYYEYVEKHMALVGRRYHRIFQIGQEIKVKLVRVDKDQREVDFELVSPEDAPKTKLRVPHDDRHDHRRGGNNNHRNGDHRTNDHKKSWNNGHNNNRQINRGQARRRDGSRPSGNGNNQKRR